MLVYIAGPYSNGDPELNILRAVEAADALVTKGHTPYIPHLTHYWHMISPKPYDFWLAYDLVWLDLCDALLRLSGQSTGADREEYYAKEKLLIKVFHSVEEVPDGVQ